MYFLGGRSSLYVFYQGGAFEVPICTPSNEVFLWAQAWAPEIIKSLTLLCMTLESQERLQIISPSQSATIHTWTAF